MRDHTVFDPIVITFRTPNGEMWNETYSMRLYDLFIKDPTVYEIHNKKTDELIYKKEVSVK